MISRREGFQPLAECRDTHTADDVTSHRPEGCSR